LLQLGTKMSWLDFEIKQLMSQVYKWSNKHFARHFLDSTMHGHLCHWNTCYFWQRAHDISKVMGSEFKVTDNIYQKCTFWWRHTDQRFTLIFVVFVSDLCYLYSCISMLTLSKLSERALCEFLLPALHWHAMFHSNHSTSSAELWCIDFQNGGHGVAGFEFGDVTHLRRSVDTRLK